MEIDNFDGFDVYKIEEGHSFVYANFNNEDKFIAGLVDYLFSENNLLNHACRIANFTFIAEPKQYAVLYKNISVFLNDELERVELGEVSDDIMDVIKDEYSLITNNGKIKIQSDKIGKIGEYAFHILLTKYFNLSCILPKFRCVTNRNMSVFGIDTLFLDIDNKIIYFGESKFSVKLENGIRLLNKSLQKYENQIKEEYRCVLSNDNFKLSDEYLNIFEKYTQVIISFEELINVASLTKIGIPIFIAHGNTGENDYPEYYIKTMREKIKKYSLFGLNTKYIFISLPVINKRKFVNIAMKKIMEKQNEYKRRIS